MSNTLLGSQVDVAAVPLPARPNEVLPECVTAIEGFGVGRRLLGIISRLAFFHGMRPDHLQLLADSALEIHFAQDETILEEGNQANRFHIILEGSVLTECDAGDPRPPSGLTLPC